jgi:hypothetical protein
MKRILLFLAVAIVTGCDVQPDRGSCPTTSVIPWPVAISTPLDYSFEDGGVDGLLGDIRLYVFDAEGKLVDVLRNASDVDLPAGEFTIVAWAASGGDLEAGGYRLEGETLDELLLHLASPEGFDDLYHAIARGVKGGAAVTLDFIRHTSVVRVTVTEEVSRGALLATPETDIYIKGKKGSYSHDGFVHPDCPELRYDAMEGDIHIQRLDLDFHKENPVTLHVESGGEPLIEPLDLIETIQKNPKYATQADFDAEAVFDIEVRLTGGGDTGLKLTVTILVDGFVVLEVEPGEVEIELVGA